MSEVIGVEGIELEEERALRSQGIGGKLGNGTIEEQRIVIRYEECQMRLVFQNITFHR